MEAQQIKRGLPGWLENNVWAAQGDSIGDNKQEITSDPL